MFFCLRAFLVGALCLALTHAGAAVLSHTRSETRFGIGALGSLEMPQFDPGAGRLDNVSIQIDSISQVNAIAEGVNTGETADLAIVQFQATLRVTDLGGQISAFVSGSTSLLISPGSQASSSLLGQVNGNNQLITDPTALLLWIGNGKHRLSWELVDLITTFQGSTSTGIVGLESVTVSVTVLYTYTPPIVPNPMQYDPTDGTFHFVEGDKPVVIELRSKLVDLQPWSVRYRTGTNTPGTLVKLPLEGETGFYRVRFADLPLLPEFSGSSAGQGFEISVWN